MDLENMFKIENRNENCIAHPMGLAVMGTLLPPVAVKLTTRRFGMDGKYPPMSNKQVAERYGLPVNVVESLISASINTITEMGMEQK